MVYNHIKILTFNFQTKPIEDVAENECKNQYPVTPTQLITLHNRDFEKIDPVDENVKCFVKCFFHKAKWINISGILLLDNIKVDAPPEIHEDIRNFVNKCKLSMGESSCDTAFKQTKCFVKEIKTIEKSYDAHWVDPVHS